MTPKRKGVKLQSERTFRNWLNGFRARYLNELDPKRVDDFLFLVRFLPDILQKDKNQAEFSLSLSDYINRVCTEDRLSLGQKRYDEWSKPLKEIEKTYGVQAPILMSIWGIETSYGQIRGDYQVFSALSTLAFDGRRRTFFETELFAAIKIADQYNVPSKTLTGSWAGAMGHMQFMPTTYQEHAIDFDRDGFADIWSENPIDALASTAAYLAYHGWDGSLPWGHKVTLPKSFEYELTAPKLQKPVSYWEYLGLSGLPEDKHAMGSIIVPNGVSGPAFWVSGNFDVLKIYNKAISYVLSVGLLSQGLKTGEYLQLDWPRETRPLKRSEMQLLQKRLSDIGCDTKGCDGFFGPNTEFAIRRFQKKNGLIADGYPSPNLLARLGL